MKILIAADMEGVTGVVHWDQVSPGHAEHGRFRRLMTADVNAAVSGAYKSGASQVIVSDGHANARNILIEELDPRPRLNSGAPSPFAMVQGIDGGIDGLIFIGYHARVGTPHAILEHTWSSRRVSNLSINGTPFGEIALNAALAGHFGVRLIMISGDLAACAEAQELVGSLEVAVVKRASGRFAAECLPPDAAQSIIHESAIQAVARLAKGQAPEPLQVATPIQMALELTTSEMADNAALLPGACRTGRTIEYTAEDMPALYAAFRSAVTLAGG
ncbi:M55 family metallopeptidase [Chloroflexota bacterium]